MFIVYIISIYGVPQNYNHKRQTTVVSTTYTNTPDVHFGHILLKFFWITNHSEFGHIMANKKNTINKSTKPKGGRALAYARIDKTKK